MVNKKNYDLGKMASAIRTLYEDAKKKKEILGEDKVFDFSIGNPSVPAPKEVRDTLVRLLSEEDPCLIHGYTSSYGDLEARVAIASDLNKRFDAKCDEKLIYMTCGASASLAISFSALINKGDKAIVLKPYFPEYKVFLENAGAIVTTVDTDSTMHIDINKIRENIDEDVKVIIINSPNNPSGVVYSEDEIRSLASLLKEKEKEYKHTIYLISDEPYRELIYEDIKYPFVTKYYDDSIVCYSFSKSLSLPGDRIGYILVSSTMKDREDIFYAICGAGRRLGYVCAPSLLQKAIPYIASFTSDLSIYKNNLNDLYTMLKSIGYDVIKPSGAFYLFVRSLEEDSNKFSSVAKKYNLYLVPSTSFGVEGYVRIAYCVKNSQIKASKDAFIKLFKHYKGEK